MGYLKSFSKNRNEAKITKETIQNFDFIIEACKEQYQTMEKTALLLQKKYDSSEIPLIFNSYMFFRITFIDLVQSFKQIRLSKDELNKNLLTRNLAVHLSECLQDFTTFTGKVLKTELKGLKDENTLLKDLYKLKEIYEAIYANSYKSLVDIRNNIGAHKDKNSLVLSDKIRNLDCDLVLQKGAFCVILYLLMLRFQNNVFYSFWNQFNSDPRNAIPLKNLLTYEPIEKEFDNLMRKIFSYIPNFDNLFNRSSYTELFQSLITIEIIKNYTN